MINSTSETAKIITLESEKLKERSSVVSVFPKNGIMNIESNNAYFNMRSIFSPLKVFIFSGKGILYNQSCNKPNGQTFPQNIFPKITAKSRKMIKKTVLSISLFYFLVINFNALNLQPLKQSPQAVQ
jgi:predicted methyltransferase